MRPALILASTSRYRRELLERLRLPFEVRVAARRRDAAARRGAGRARRGGSRSPRRARWRRAAPDAIVIGSDQVADLDGQPLGKPGDHDRATAQLRAMSGRSVVFHTGVAVVRAGAGFTRTARGAGARCACARLTDAEIERYLDLEQPYDCAGSAKSEALGIALLEAIESDDPTALVGLPLIRTCAMLRAAGLDPLAA